MTNAHENHDGTTMIAVTGEPMALLIALEQSVTHPRQVDGIVAYLPGQILPKRAMVVGFVTGSRTVTILSDRVPVTQAAVDAAWTWLVESGKNPDPVGCPCVPRVQDLGFREFLAV